MDLAVWKMACGSAGSCQRTGSCGCPEAVSPGHGREAAARVARSWSMLFRIIIVPLAIIATILATGCKEAVLPPTALPPLVPVAGEDLPSFQDDMDLDSLKKASLESLEYLERVPPEKAFTFGNDTYTRDEVIDSVHALVEMIDTHPSPEEFRRLLQENFVFYESSGMNGQGAVLFTGYYLPVLHGSRYPQGEYVFPIYARPDDIVFVDLRDFGPDYPQRTLVGRVDRERVVPYYTRYQIDHDQALAGRGYELAYVTDPIDLFFLHIQGSGLLQFEDGGTVFVQYEGANGRPYRSIGKLLIDAGRMTRDEVSLASLKEYLRFHPEEQERALCYNESYVFFRLAEDGPRGCLGRILTPGRSIATDSRVFPKGAPAVIMTEKPVVGADGKVAGWVPFARVVLNQDTGGAITGPGRVDIYWGSGSYAETAAGYLKHRGRLFFLVKKRGPN